MDRTGRAERTQDPCRLAERVAEVAREKGLSPTIENLTNPRIEQEDHYYAPDHQGLIDLGYKPTRDMKTELGIMFDDLIRYKDRIMVEAITPRIKWDGSHNK